MDGYSNKPALLPPTTTELHRLADQARKVVINDATDSPADPAPRQLQRRLSPAVVAEIVRRYAQGEQTPQLCVEYGVSKGGLLKLLRDQGVEVRRQPLQTDVAQEIVRLYEGGRTIARIADQLGVASSSVQLALVREGTPRRPRGGRTR